MPDADAASRALLQRAAAACLGCAPEDPHAVRLAAAWADVTPELRQVLEAGYGTIEAEIKGGLVYEARVAGTRRIKR